MAFFLRFFLLIDVENVYELPELLLESGRAQVVVKSERKDVEDGFRLVLVALWLDEVPCSSRLS
jgi:hypothetical protein